MFFPSTDCLQYRHAREYPVQIPQAIVAGDEYTTGDETKQVHTNQFVEFMTLQHLKDGGGALVVAVFTECPQEQVRRVPQEKGKGFTLSPHLCRGPGRGEGGGGGRFLRGLLLLQTKNHPPRPPLPRS